MNIKMQEAMSKKNKRLEEIDRMRREALGQ